MCCLCDCEVACDWDAVVLFKEILEQIITGIRITCGGQLRCGTTFFTHTSAETVRLTATGSSSTSTPQSTSSSPSATTVSSVSQFSLARSISAATARLTAAGRAQQHARIAARRSLRVVRPTAMIAAAAGAI